MLPAIIVASALTDQGRLLTERLEQSDRRLQEVQQSAEEAQGAAAKNEADLKALSSAYAGLEAHAYELENKLALAEKSRGDMFVD